MQSLKIENLRVSSLKVGASLEFANLNRNPAWKFEAAATQVARRSKAKDRWRRIGVHRAARRLEFESLRAWSLKLLNPGSLKV